MKEVGYDVKYDIRSGVFAPTYLDTPDFRKFVDEDTARLARFVKRIGKFDLHVKLKSG